MPLLQKEAKTVELSVVSEGLERDLRKGYTRLEIQLEDAWCSYMDEERCASLYGVREDTAPGNRD